MTVRSLCAHFEVPFFVVVVAKGQHEMRRFINLHVETGTSGNVPSFSAAGAAVAWGIQDWLPFAVFTSQTHRRNSPADSVCAFVISTQPAPTGEHTQLGWRGAEETQEVNAPGF